MVIKTNNLLKCQCQLVQWDELKGREMNHKYTSKHFLQIFMVRGRQKIRIVSSRDKFPSKKKKKYLKMFISKRNLGERRDEVAS